MSGAYPKCRSRFRPHSVIYKLKGGLQAQKRFQTLQNDAAKSLLGLDLSLDAAGALDSSNVLDSTRWTKENAKSNGLVREYVLAKNWGIESTRIGKSLSAVLESVDDQESLGDDVASDELHKPKQSPTVEEMLLGTIVDINVVLSLMGICKRYTYTGCLTMRLKSSFPRKFYCHVCSDHEQDFNTYKNLFPQITKPQELEMVEKRPFAGKGVLVKHSNNFYYPGRMIYWDKHAKHGSVQMWRGIQNDLAGTIIEKIPVKNIVDGLSMDQKGRRKIQLGYYTRPLLEHVRKLEEEDGSLLNFGDIHCPAEIQNVLMPHRKSGRHLMANPLVYTGGLLDTELAAINAWVHTRFPKSVEMDHLTMLHNSITHARTLLVAHKFHSELAEVAADADNLHLKAWERLTEWTGLTADGKAKKVRGADVNFEAIALLAKVMFDESVNAGMAGNHQWGLGVGPHELAWSPNMSGPSVTNAPLRDGDDEIELAKGANYDYAAELQEEERRKAKNPPAPLLKQARPQPKLRKRVFDEDFAEELSQRRALGQESKDDILQSYQLSNRVCTHASPWLVNNVTAKVKNNSSARLE
ncbi:hypothetical protein BDP27DRAFT_1407198 [Rhodocollybia butyracea]|uniref:Uncharacterized protein n=1 Tax=Rhodocollybia butyracea TaxID=206335 RepID=A0A9P5TYA2_9AGAR|nr:hypothetical protein BDP27DRAFT_1407198 [Rhodocollybia butyracea]